MRILQLNLTDFAKFHNITIDLKDKNIITGLNESGKSTIYKFIEGMFYGFVKPYLRTLRFTDDFEKYKPWNGTSYRGSLVFEFKDCIYRLNRDFVGKSYEIIDELTGKNVGNNLKGFERSNLGFPGEYFFGVSSSIFSATLLFSQKNLDIEGRSKSDIRDLLTNIINSSSESISVYNSIKYLLELKSKIGTDKSKRKPYGSMVNKKEELKKTISENMNLTNEYFEAIKLIQEINENIVFFTNRKKSIDNQKLENEKLRLLTNEKRLVEISKEIDELELKLRKISKVNLVSEEEIGYYQKLQANRESIQSRINQLSKSKKSIYKDMKEIQLKIRERDLILSKKIEIGKTAKRFEKSKKLPLFSLIAFIISTVFGIILGSTGSHYSPHMFIISALFFVIFIILAFKSNKRKAHLNIMSEEFCKEYDLPLQGINELLTNNIFDNDDEHMESNFQLLNNNLDELDKNIDQLLTKEAELMESITNITMKVRNMASVNIEDVSKAKLELKNINELLAIKKQEQVRLINDNDFDKLKSKDFLEHVHHEETNIDDEETVILKLDELTLKKTRLQQKVDMLESSVNTLLLAKEELVDVDREIDLMEENLNAIDIAIEKINIAQNQVHRNYIPRISSYITENMKIITDSQNSYALDEGFNISFLEQSDKTHKDNTYLSAGTHDQVSILLRIAIVNEIFQEKTTIIFDDAFVNFDDNRLRKILGYLDDMKVNNQVIIFSCQKREKELAEELNMKYNLINIDEV